MIMARPNQRLRHATIVDGCEDGCAFEGSAGCPLRELPRIIVGRRFIALRIGA